MWQPGAPKKTRGSCRSIPEFHITDTLDLCKDLLVRHGGHAAAAGFTVRNDWNHSTVHGAASITAATQLMTAVAIGLGFGWAPWASDYSRFTRPDISEKRLYWASALGTFIALNWLGVLRRRDGQQLDQWRSC